jgi:hypothetical protein
MNYIIEVVTPGGKSAEFEWGEREGGFPAFLAWLSERGGVAYQSINPSRTFVCIVLGDTRVN